MGFFRNIILKWLGFQPAQEKNIKIKESLTYSDYVLMNQIWYRGDPWELSQFYKALGNTHVNESRFWTVVPPEGLTIRKIHSGLPSLIIDMLNDITNDDFLGVTFGEKDNQDTTIQTVWDDIAIDNDFDKIRKDATKDMLTEGDVVFKVSIDSNLSKFPIIETYSGDEVAIVYKRGRIDNVVFKTMYEVDDKIYQFIETYSKGKIENRLENENGKEVPLETVPELEGIEPIVTFSGDFIMAVPMMIAKSSKFKGRGKALLETKYDLFDALDEVISQWLDAVRLGRANKFIPEDLIPRDTNGNKIPLNPIVNQFYTYSKGRVTPENEAPKPEVTQPQIEADKFLASYIQFLDMCLMGIISPSTLGIDVKKLDNGEAQREKEKATLYTRNKIIAAMRKAVPELVKVVLMTFDNMTGKTPGEYEPSIEFGEYANPSFEAVVETVGKAKTYGIMSVEKAVDELYGDSLTEEEKAEEVAKIKEQNSSTFDMEFPLVDPNNIDDEDDPEDDDK